MSSRVFVFCNNKGGITKTTSTINIGYGLARSGHRVLIIDSDPQSNTTWTIVNNISEDGEDSIYDVIINKRPLHEVIVPTRDPNLFLLPGSLLMSLAEVQLFQMESRERKLRNALKPYLNKFDYVLIDTPPNLGMITVNALMACTDVIIPLTLNEYSLVGISILLNAIKKLRDSAEENELDAKMPIFGVLVSQTRDTKDAQDHKQKIIRFFGDLVIEPSVPLNVKVEEANNPGKGGSLYDLYPTSAGAIAYAQITQAIIKRTKETEANRAAYLQQTTDLFATIAKGGNA